VVEKSMKRLLIGLAILLLLVGFLVKEANSWWTQERELEFDISYDLDKGNNLSRISKELKKLGLIEYPMLFRLMVLYEGKFRVKAGHYKFVGKVSPREVYHTLRDGKEFLEVVLTFTIPEGFTLNQIMNRLAANKVASLNELQALIIDRSLFEEFNINSTTLEGYLYPDTYVYHNQFPTAKNVLRDLIKNFVKNLPSNYEEDLKKVNLTLPQGIIFASLIERETKHDDERAKISEVIWNRLRADEPLGIDAGLIYGIKNYDGDIRSRDLVDRSNPYNSRIFKGLPPTPIGSPSRKSMEAVLTPTNEGLYFYVLVPDGQERHHFSKTVGEHNVHVKRLLRGSK
jgi:UPF0755 protein